MSDSNAAITVNGHRLAPEAITFELSRLVRFYAQHMSEDAVRQQLPVLRRRAIDQAIGARLLIDEANRLDIQVSEEEVDRRIAELTAQAGGAEALQKMLREQRSTPELFREQVRRGRRVDKLVELVTSEVPEPTEDEIKAHFEAHREEYGRSERVLAQHILVKPADETPASREAAHAKLETIRGRVLAGADFAGEAAAHSECPSGREGGSLGWFSRGMMVKEFDEAVFAMGVGELSEIIETQFGFHIIRKTDEEPAGDADFDEVRESVRDFLRHARRGEALSAHVAELRAKATIEGVPA